MKLELGVKAKDKITGFEGIVTGVASYLTGCNQWLLQPPAKDGAYVEGRWLDEGKIEAIGEGINAKEVKAEENGCDAPSPHN